MHGTKYLTKVFESSSREVPFIKAERKGETVLEPMREKVFFTGVAIILLVFHSRPVRTNGPPSVGGHPNVHFGCCHCRDSNSYRRNLKNKCQRLNDIGQPDPLFGSALKASVRGF